MTIFRVMFSGEKDLCVCENHLADFFQAIILKKGKVSPAVAIDENLMTLCEWEPQDLPCETEPSKRLQQYVDDRLKGHMALLRRELAEGRYVTMKELAPVSQAADANARQLDDLQAAILREQQWRVGINNRLHAVEAGLSFQGGAK